MSHLRHLYSSNSWIQCMIKTLSLRYIRHPSFDLACFLLHISHFPFSCSYWNWIVNVVCIWPGGHVWFTFLCQQSIHFNQISESQVVWWMVDWRGARYANAALGCIRPCHLSSSTLVTLDVSLMAEFDWWHNWYLQFMRLGISTIKQVTLTCLVVRDRIQSELTVSPRFLSGITAFHFILKGLCYNVIFGCCGKTKNYDKDCILYPKYLWFWASFV
jgi:hypothetical protein